MAFSRITTSIANPCRRLESFGHMSRLSSRCLRRFHSHGSKSSKSRLGKSGVESAVLKLPSVDQIEAFVQELESSKAQHSQTHEIRKPDTRAGFLGHYEKPGGFSFRVGDIVVHRLHGQVGVIAERFDTCQLGGQWFKFNSPPGMNFMQPFYSILVSMPGSSFIRHGGQSSHRRWDAAADGPPPSIQHPDLAHLFCELDAAGARYLPRYAGAAGEEGVMVPEWDERDT
eukprot:TRINITY_DN108590_c0_g1_i1.p1 TRINITY_DN108590_c0_g1~~TRINITY_DN108590_c0_g1_i1.p1  ORF type:complete len:228 (-),score=33.32 TRINITY_DN108590_c0_g1_i1:39-722(-)